MKRVLIIVQNLPVPFDRRVWLEATTLTMAGYTVSVICPKAKGFTASFERLEGIDICRYSVPMRRILEPRIRIRVPMVLRTHGSAFAPRRHGRSRVRHFACL